MLKLQKYWAESSKFRQLQKKFYKSKPFAHLGPKTSASETVESYKEALEAVRPTKMFIPSFSRMLHMIVSIGPLVCGPSRSGYQLRELSYFSHLDLYDSPRKDDSQTSLRKKAKDHLHAGLNLKRAVATFQVVHSFGFKYIFFFFIIYLFFIFKKSFLRKEEKEGKRKTRGNKNNRN